MFGPCGVVVIGEMIAPAGSPVVTPASYMRDIFTPRGGKRDTHTHPPVDQRVYYTLWRDTGLRLEVPRICLQDHILSSVLNIPADLPVIRSPGCYGPYR